MYLYNIVVLLFETLKLLTYTLYINQNFFPKISRFSNNRLTNKYITMHNAHNFLILLDKIDSKK